MEITVRTKDELDKAVKDKYNFIYIDGPIKDELVKKVKNNSKKGFATSSAGLIVGSFLGGPFAIVGLGALVGGAVSGLKYSKYNLCMDACNKYYLQLK